MLIYLEKTSQVSAIRSTSAQELVNPRGKGAYQAVPVGMAGAEVDEEHTLEFPSQEEPLRSWLRSKSVAEGPRVEPPRSQNRRATSTDSPPWWLQSSSPTSGLGQDRYQLLTTRSSATMPHPSERVLSSGPVSAAPTDGHPASPSNAEELAGVGRGDHRTSVTSVHQFRESLAGPDQRSLMQGLEQVIDNKSVLPSQEQLPVGKMDDPLRGDVLPWIREAPAFSPGARSDKVFWGRSDSITDEREPMMVAAVSPFGGQPLQEAIEMIELEADFYALSLSPQVSCHAAFCAPIVSAIAQLSVLYFLAFQNENMFEEGKWKQPISPYWSLNVMKLISIVVSLFKVSTELQHAQQLCRALFVGRFQEDFRQVAGWWALALQYSTALCVLFVSLSIVLGATSCVGCFLKIFSVFIIVDMDNLAAKFVNGMIFLEFHVTVDPERLRAFRQRHRERIKGISIRTIFMIMPVALILLSGIVSLYFNTTPLTLLVFGQVDNVHAPKMINIGGCCPPILRLEHLKGEGVAANVSVLLLAAINPTEEEVKVAPRLYWIALESQAEPMIPSSLQVLQGTDANNNAAFRSGSAQTTRSQSYHWLELHHPEGAASPYKTLLKQEKMYKTMEPFEASFQIRGIQAEYPTTYTVFVTAQNPTSRALAGTPAKGSLLIPACASFCESCEFTGARFCDPGRCIAGTHYHQGRCYPCVENCDSCEFSAAPLDFGAVNMTDSESIKCDYGGCKRGYGHQGGRCLPCKVENCRDCNEDLGSCGLCMPGLGLDSNGTCQQCGGPHCRCYEKGGCDECEEGWGPAANATCVQCEPGCRLCSSSHETCKNCELGYVMKEGHCARCVPHCRNCSVSGVHSCDECYSGWGLNMLTMKCDTCEVENCLKCNGDQRRCTECKYGFGVTPEGLCQDCGEYCKTCDAINDCKVCQAGFVSIEGQCHSCADRCNFCSKAGPAKCDHCFQGFHLTKEAICERGPS